MPFFEEFGKISEVSEHFNPEHGLTPEITEEISNISESMKESLQIDIAFEAKPSPNGLTWEIGNEPIKIRDVEFGEAIADPAIEAAEVVDSFVSASEKSGLNIDSHTRAVMEDAVKSNPQRSLNEIKEIPESVKTTSEKIVTPEIENLDSQYDKATSEAQKQEIAKQIDEKFAESSEMKDLQSKIESLSEELKDPEKKAEIEKSLSEKVMDGAKLLALIAGGILTYDMIKQYQNAIKGCWEAKSNGKSVVKTKIRELTCDNDAKNQGSFGKVGSFCDSKVTGDCVCDNKLVSIPLTGCGYTCGANEKSLCSTWCSNDHRLTTDSNGNIMSYTCNDPSFLDTVEEITNGIAGQTSNVLTTVWKIIKWVVVIAVLIFCGKFLYKIFTAQDINN